MPTVAFCNPASIETVLTSFHANPEAFATRSPMISSDKLSVTRMGPNFEMLAVKVSQPLKRAATTMIANNPAPMSENVGSMRIENAGRRYLTVIPRSTGIVVTTKTASARSVIVTSGALAPIK